MFSPDEVIFAPTGRCNLHCAHCRVSRGAAELSVDRALGFLESCAEAGIERVGFSGGEPFLRPDFLAPVIQAAVEKGLMFDRLMTNGAWWADEGRLRNELRAVYDAGFDGVLGLSYDAYHGQDASTVAVFLKTAFEVWGRRDMAEILSVRSSDDARFLADLALVASALGGRVDSDDGEPVRLVDDAYLTRDAATPDDGSGLVIPVLRSPRSAAAGEAAWGAASWFQDDYCAGPGNVLYVHPDGSVAVCCGFANERPELIVGKVDGGVPALLAAADANAHVRACYVEGLGAYRARLEGQGVRFPGKTRDMCFFCDWLCDRGLTGR
ncbi:MAG: radical SAM protein [Spirochaetia bacterium]|nr:radical SAM protein [Spirochaetia bacterium]